MRLPEERYDPRLKKLSDERRALGKIPHRHVQSMTHHKQNAENLAKKSKPEKLRSTFDFDLWGEHGKKTIENE